MPYIVSLPLMLAETRGAVPHVIIELLAFAYVLFTSRNRYPIAASR